MAGCSSFQSSGIDPTGEHLFTPPPPPTTAVAVAPVNPYPPNERYFDDPLGPLPWDDVAVLIEPREMLSSEAKWWSSPACWGPTETCEPIAGSSGRSRRAAWGSSFPSNRAPDIDLLLGDFNWPRIVNATTAVGSTSRSNVRLNRGAAAGE